MLARATGAWEAAKAPGARSERSEYHHRVPDLPLALNHRSKLAASDADPAQVAFSPDGSMIVITERGTDSIVIYAVTPDGTFGTSLEISSEGPTP
jgi:hypothetical protein